MDKKSEGRMVRATSHNPGCLLSPEVEAGALRSRPMVSVLVLLDLEVVVVPGAGAYGFMISLVVGERPRMSDVPDLR